MDVLSLVLPWRVDQATVMHAGAVIIAAVIFTVTVAAIWRIKAVSAVFFWAFATVVLSALSSGFGPNTVLMGTTVTLGAVVICLGLVQFLVPELAARWLTRR